MPLTLVDTATSSGGAANEDRAGAIGNLGWIIDGATDVLDAPLTGAASDAAWFAETLHSALCDRAQAPPDDLKALVHDITERAACAFALAARRPPTGRVEHPSAAGIIVRVEGRRLDYVSLGDCALIAGAAGQALAWHGIGASDAGDAALAAAIERFNRSRPAPSAAAARRHIWPQVRARRAAMNTPEGYGVLSITPVPDRFIVSGSIELASGAHALLLTDGLARLVDVFRRYAPARLHAAACARGIADLVAELRAIEAADPECATYPRAKPSDDATGLLLAIAS